MFAGDGYAGTSLLTKREGVRLGVGAGLAATAGVAKEVYDRYSGGDASLRDLTWDVVGAMTGAMLSWLIDSYLLRKNPSRALSNSRAECSRALPDCTHAILRKNPSRVLSNSF